MASSLPSRLLLVEDNPLVAQNMVRQLNRHWPKMIVDIASTLQDAHRFVRENRYTHWLVDVNMPDGSGTELLTDSPVPAVVLGMSGTFQDVTTMARFTQFFQKPFSVLDLGKYFENR